MRNYIMVGSGEASKLPGDRASTLSKLLTSTKACAKRLATSHFKQRDMYRLIDPVNKYKYTIWETWCEYPHLGIGGVA